ncbi:MAG TPA: VWA domain-containing protein, partial [Hymenobacter sp.]
MSEDQAKAFVTDAGTLQRGQQLAQPAKWANLGRTATAAWGDCAGSSSKPYWQALKEIVLCVDQSGSMAASVVYAGVFGAVLASLAAVKTHMVVFDTAVVNLRENLRAPVDLLFGVQLGGGTDINLALGYCQQLI